MKNNIKMTKMQLAKKHAVKPQINDAQTKNISIELEQVSKRLKHSLRNRGRRARAVKQVSCYVGMDLGDKNSNYCAYSGDVVQLFHSKLSTCSGDVVHPIGAKRRWLLIS